MSLKKYQQKRNFASTTEPSGKTSKTAAKTNSKQSASTAASKEENADSFVNKAANKNLKQDKNKAGDKTSKNLKEKQEEKRFVIQYHEARAKHFDFRLEYGGVLLSWAVPKGLSTNPKTKRLAVMVEDHPVDYITFEGIIPKGNYGAGTVEIFDKGTYLPIKNFEDGLKHGHLKFVLNGDKLKGAWQLIKTKDSNWFIMKISDEFAKKDDKKQTKLPFLTANCQLCALTDKIPTGKDWIFEIKYDGFRMLAFKEDGKVKLLSRNGQNYSAKFESIAKALQQIDQTSFVVDGEVVVFDELGRSDFGRLQTAIKQKQNNFFYVIFDLLAQNGEDLRLLPLEVRKQKLERLLFDCQANLIYSQHVKDGKESFEFACKNQLEGIVAKKTTSLYLGKRNEDWLKIKCVNMQEFVVAGFTTSEKNEVLSALVLGYYRDDALVFVGKVGTGFDEKTKEQLRKKFEKLQSKTCPFASRPKLSNVTWLVPQLVAQIKFAQLTKDDVLRQPVFVGLRTDKAAKSVKLEKENGN